MSATGGSRQRGSLPPQVTERARLLTETQQLLSRTLIRLLPLVAATFPRLGEGFSKCGKVSGLRAKCAVSPEAPPLRELAHEVRLKE